MSTTLLLGATVFRLFLAPSSHTDGVTWRTLRRVAFVGMATTAASVVPRSVALSEAGLPAAWDPGALWFVLQSRFGAAALLHIAGLTLLLCAGRVACVIGGALVLGAYALTGHAWATRPEVLLVLVHVVHIAAVSTWFGGVVLLAVELWRLRRQGRASELAQVVLRFSHTAMVTVGLAAATGCVLAASQLASLDALVDTPYGRAFVAKLGVLSLPLALGGYNARRLVPAIARDEQRAWNRLCHTLTAEAVLIAVGVLLLTTAMTTGGLG